jgi:drug/metabolite transporter (DMT)-like permease
LRVAPTTLVSTYAYINPLVAIFMGWMLAGEEITPRVLLAAVFILGSVIVITLNQSVKPKSAPSQSLSPTRGDD